MSTPLRPVDNSAPLTVSALNRQVRDCLENSFPLQWITGEISNLTYAASGHVYFSLKDAGAQVRCVMWRSRAQTLGWRLANGQQIDARSLVGFYEPRGEFQLNVEAIRRAGQGDLFERFLRLKTQLENEGLFAVDRKRPLPPLPRHLGIVTSLQAAALRDVLSTLQRRAPALRLSIFPCPVQGEDAGQRIADALQQASDSDCELLILCRGGGSIEDLWAFNEAVVARAIRACRLPVITGIGHETDFTIADFAADLRAPTPTAAAELACPDHTQLRARLGELARQLSRQTERQTSVAQQALDRLAQRLLHPAERLQQQGAALHALGQRLQRAWARRQERQQLRNEALARRLHHARPRPAAQQRPLDDAQQRLHHATHWQLARHQMKLNGLTASLKQLDPMAVLDRGYALVIGPDGQAIYDANTVDRGQRVDIRLARGRLAAQVTDVVAASQAD
ncbi:MAG: exodeoxyribonuclease VII large subunit [Dechloromonas sp.]|nr:exodeoxyribonuclease VII large subunit [Dechloromonas sp.]